MPDITLGLTIPGETIITKVIDAWMLGRSTMNQENRDVWDDLFTRLIRVILGRLEALPK